MITDDRRREPPALLHSLLEFWPIISACLDAVTPSAVVEIGSETGALTQRLCTWARDRACTVTAVEPDPRMRHHELVEELGLRLVKGKSPGALGELGPVDVAIVDGDHNHWVVSQELRALHHDGHAPLTILHDVGWPCARRDQYYDPSDIPVEHRHPYSYEGGVVPGETEMVMGGGMRGEGAFAYAIREGGPRNGVLTAVEDFLAEHAGLQLMVIPCIFGVGVLLPTDASWAPQVRSIVAPYADNPLLERMERNRLDLYLRLIGSAAPTRDPARGVRDLLAAQNNELDRLQAQLGNLRRQLAERA